MIDDITPYWLGTARALREPGQIEGSRAPAATRSIIYPTSARQFLSFPLSAGPVNFIFEMSFTHVSYIQTTAKRKRNVLT